MLGAIIQQGRLLAVLVLMGLFIGRGSQPEDAGANDP